MTLKGDLKMIYDRIENAEQYFKACKGMSSAFKFLREKCSRGIGCGKYRVGAGILAIVQEYESKDRSEGFFEAHRKYVDIQIVLKGTEVSGIASLKDCRTTQKYDSEKDFSKLDGGNDFITLKKGNFAVFFPHDAHMPGIRCGTQKEKIRKVVFKLPV